MKRDEIIARGVKKLLEILKERGGKLHMAALQYEMFHAHVFPGGPVGDLRDPGVMFNVSVYAAETAGKVSYDKSTGCLSLVLPQ